MKLSSTREHYENHLAHFYSWMSGNFQENVMGFKKFLSENSITPGKTKNAVDLGAGHGIQSIALAQMGFNVIAVDFNELLLSELRSNAAGLHITAIHDDVKNVKQFSSNPELIVCCGDTLSHLDNKKEVEDLIADIANSLNKNGKVILSFRDYSAALCGTSRFIPVKSDENKILTCILDYEEDFVNVTDLLYERINECWQQKISSYRKVRLTTIMIEDLLTKNGLTIKFNQIVNRLTTIIAVKN